MMNNVNPIQPGTSRVLPTHELNARRRRKRSTLPHVPVTVAAPNQGTAKPSSPGERASHEATPVQR